MLPFQSHLCKAYNLIPVVLQAAVQLDLADSPNILPIVLKIYKLKSNECFKCEIFSGLRFESSCLQIQFTKVNNKLRLWI